MTRLLVTPSPCRLCPFRSDVPVYLRRDRREEIARGLLDGQEFFCHGTVDYDQDEDEGPSTAKAAACAGAAKALLAAGGTTPAMRFAERFGQVDLDALATAGPDVWDLNDWVRVPEGATADDPGDVPEVETCNTVGPYCIAPAGYMGFGGAVITGGEAADSECRSCGEAVCSECVDDDGLCGDCAEWEAAESRRDAEALT